uniref:Structural maintenance of chromosomes flexible hinge domain containing 1 n=1 Tax=Cyclopterus lumpus TaxID=8103 RepID=A0A8C3AMC9_CYCLU
TFDILLQTFSIRPHETFVLATTDRIELQDGRTLHMLQREDQALATATEELIKFVPHYDTLIKGGQSEYYNSEGQKSLAYALAELIDNSLSATSKNTGMRTIEIQMVFDETLAKPTIIILDNGCGMTSKQLKNWAVFRLSKFSRKNVTVGGKEESYVRPEPVCRSLNSDVSYFGVGGKVAVFFFGNSTRMITKSIGSPDVHELILSKEEFERKERDNEDIYTSVIKNRRPGDSSHLKKDERCLRSLIAEEHGKESFTAVVITGLFPEHITFLKKDFKVWTRQLAHVYHYYIHGVNGKDTSSCSSNSDHLPKIDIQITLCEKPPKLPCALNLREVDDDMQTLYINAAVDTFDFTASPKDGGTVEGLIRYHPFLYDKETYPEDPNALLAWHQTRKKGLVFDCFWNGRLIPYTKVQGFDWCSPNKGAKELAECYNRISGVLFSNDVFEVSITKLSFMHLEDKLNKKDTFFTRTNQRGNIQKEFTQWLKNCHEKWDKQVKFLGYTETITRTDIPTKKMQHPWATFSSIEWDGKIYKEGQFVKSMKTVPILYGRVVRFLLHGKYDNSVFATGGEVEVALVRRELFGLNTRFSKSPMRLYQLPELLTVDWPEGKPWPQNAARPAGTPFGKLQHGFHTTYIHILLIVDNHNRVTFSKCPFTPPISLQENLTKRGKYTLSLNTKMHETNATAFGGRELPSYILKFTINAGCAETFVVGEVSATLHVGVPFDIPLLITDGYDHSVPLPPDLKPVLKCSLVDKSTIFDLNNLLDPQEKRRQLLLLILQTYALNVTLPGLKSDTQTIKICLLPGNPHSIHVTPEDDTITVENGNPVKFNVEIQDEAGNITARPKQVICCQVQGFPLVATDCSVTGAGQLVTKLINLKIINGEPQNLQVKFEIPVSRNRTTLSVSQLKVLPSTRVSRMELCSSDNLVLTNNEKIDWLAGGLLDNLFYKLYDEAGREVPPTAKIASKIKVHWTGDVNIDDLVEGKLPAVHVPTQVQPALFFEVSYQDQNLSVSFYIVPRPDEPDRLKATLLQNTVKLGEILPGSINVLKIMTDILTAGVPAQLKLISGPEKPLQVLNDQGIATPFLIQLFDEWGNPTTDQRVVLMSHRSLIGVLLLCCSTRGHYRLEFKGSFNQKPISGPTVNLTVIPDPNKPVSLLVEYSTSAVFPAGGHFPVFSVTVVSDEGSPMTTFNPAAASMWLWKGEPSGNAPPQAVNDLPSSLNVNIVYVFFHCRDKEIPELVGKYTIQFSLQMGNGKVLFSNQIPINVVANQPVKLGPNSQLPTPVVSNSKVMANRTLVENMTLRIMDSYGNAAGQDLEGKVVVSIKNFSGDGNKSLPLFEGGTSSLMIRLVKGAALINRLVMMENSPGEHGSAYILLFKPEALMVPTPLVPFELPFHFSNDAENQRKITELSRKKNELTTSITASREIFSTYRELLTLLTILKSRSNLRNCSIFLFNYKSEADQILKTPRRVFSIQDPFIGQQDVLGMVGHLASVQGDDAAWVISWHIRGDMDCVITKTSAAAQRIYDYTGGRQQVMALDSVFVHPGNRSMPHIRNDRLLFDPPGNPVHAMDLLQYPHNPENCIIAFKNILGDTILIDDLDSAINYRKAVVQNKLPCPTILTRQGDRVSAKGKFGGAQNKALPMNTLHVFGAPIPQHYYTLKQQIDLLTHHRSAVEMRDRAAKDREEHLKNIMSPKNLKRHEEMEEKEKQLEEIQRQLGMFVDLVLLLFR